MTFLHVARRELQAAARNKATFRTRLASAVIATGIATLMLLFLSVSGAARQAGAALFSTLVTLAFVFSAAGGVFLAADSLSEERREGTLGFLFLTPLNGWDVLMGKLAAVGLNALFGLMAAFPVIAAAWFLGGVTAGEFWRSLLILLNTLFASVSLCLLVSSRGRVQSRTLGVAGLLVAAWMAGPPLVAALAGRFVLPAGLARIGLLSPQTLIATASDFAYPRNPWPFWQGIGLQHALAWTALGIGGWLLQRSWRSEPPERVDAAGGIPAASPSPASTRIRRKLLDTDPVRALIAGTSFLPRFAWALGGLALLFGAGSAFAVAMNPAMNSATLGVIVTGIPTVFGVFRLGWKILFAWEACVFFAESRRNGGLELLLSTPVTDRELIAAHRRHLHRTFFGPAFLVILGEVLADVGILGFADATRFSGNLLVNLAFGTVGLAIQAEAMASLGAWLSLGGARTTSAFGRTLAFGSLIPGLFCCVGWVGAGILAGWARNRLAPGARRILTGDLPGRRPSEAAYGAGATRRKSP